MSLLGCSATKKEAAKKTSANNIRFNAVGAMSHSNISKLVVAVRGMAMQGPISKYTSDMNTMASGFEIVSSIERPSLNLAKITMAKIGTTTDVHKNPKSASGVLPAACTPRNGAKIKFPAPKNIENNMRPIQNIF